MDDHDRLFHVIQSNPENARDYITGVMPEDIRAVLSLETLRLEKDSFVDSALKKHYTDLVYSCRSTPKGEIKITFLFEHKSSKPEIEHLQLLRYKTNIWMHQLSKKEPLSPVIALVFYHGRKPFVQKPFRECFTNCPPALFRFIPHFDYLLTDIARYDDRDIAALLFHHGINRAMALLLKYSRQEQQLIAKTKEIFSHAAEFFDNPAKRQQLEAMIYYLLKQSEIEPDELANDLKELHTSGGKFAMNTATRLINQGKQEGKVEGKLEGKLEGKHEDARRMLDEKLPVDLIQRVTGLSTEEIEGLQD